MPAPPSDVVSSNELARAAGVPLGIVERRLASGAVPRLPGGYVSWAQAIRVGRQLRGAAAAAVTTGPPHDVLVPVAEERVPTRRASLMLSSTVHAAVFAVAVLLSSTGALTTERPSRDNTVMPARLVYLATPGPGGGGGGGGLKQATPPPPVKREGRHEMPSPVPPPPPDPAPQPPRAVEPPPVAPIVAPVASLPADAQTQPGVLESTQTDAATHGSGVGGGTGSGAGTGMGEGSGSGIGEGTGGGMGGGVYRPGSGIDPPRLLREVKAEYTEDARRRGVTGEVMFEVVVRRDGSVGDMRMLQGLGYGLDQRAADALRQWRFAPATRQGVPVDVLVEVSVEFRLR